MLISFSLFDFVLCIYACFVSSVNFVFSLNACFVFSVQFRILPICLFRFLCSIAGYVYMLVSFSLFNFVLSLNSCFVFSV